MLGSEQKTYVHHEGFCPNCGYIFTQNPFTAEQLENRYKNMSKFEYDTDEYFLDDGFAAQSLRQQHFLEENLDFNTINSIIEVGAASGYNLSLYQEKCSVLCGIEPSAKNCKLAKKFYGITMFNGMFNEYLASENAQTFDLVFLSMVLEHIVNPAAFIRDLSQICNKYMFIEIPTLDLRHREEPFGIFCEEHVSLFTLDSLAEMMRRAGFRLVNVENIYGLNRFLPAGFPAISTIWEKNTETLPLKYNLFSAEELLEHYISDSEKGLNRVRSIIDSIPETDNLAIWGVGHHASMLLSNTSLKQKNIVRVYDSDVRKHGMLFAGLPITSFDTDDLSNGSVNKILLTTYTAQAAIERYLQKTGIKCNLITLY